MVIRLLNAFCGPFLLALLIVGAPAQAVPMQATVTWSAPTTGSPVHHYQLQLKTDEGEFINHITTTATSALLTLESGRTYWVRVCGIDAIGRQGLWSASSEPYTPDLGVPGACGKPIVVQN